MAYIKEYWEDKKSRAEQAGKHTEDMERLYGNSLVADSVKKTAAYNPGFVWVPKRDPQNTVVVVEDLDSVSAVMKYSAGEASPHEKTAVLNFASYKNPGGMFLNGSRAQEECLCHASYLYNVLRQFEGSFYAWNRQHKNRALYLDRALYTPWVLFEQDGASVCCNVITCAAPNKSVAQKYQNVSDAENTSVLRQRIQFVLDIAEHNYVDTLILGVYGCGVFGQDASEVAGIFKECLSSTHRCFKKVVFAIPEGRDGNLQAFRSVFGE